MLIDELRAWVDAHEENLIQDITTLVAINSERMPEEPGMPFGKGPKEALLAAKDMIAGYNFPVKLYGDAVMSADLNDKPSRLDMLAHLDVVPAGEGWTVTEPFKAKVQDGKIYGRGTADDKGPALCGLYAMLAVRELGLPLTGNCRLVLGTDEECGSGDLPFYYAEEKEAPMTFSPDADFPLINIEKAMLRMGLSKKLATPSEGVRLVSIDAGTKVNVVPGKARAVVAGIKKDALQALCDTAAAATGTEIVLTEETDGIHILVVGEGAHAASPEHGCNAVTALIALFAEVPFADAETVSAFKALAKLFPHRDYYGGGLGVAQEDEESGKLTLSLDILKVTDGELSAQFDCRAPLCANDDNATHVAEKSLAAAGFATETRGMIEAHHVSADSDFVKTLLSCYEEVSGKPGKPIAIGGGTYVHHLANGVAFGCAEEGVDNRMHGADEFAVVEQLKKSIVIFALAIARLCA